jgi:peptide/nickel transport system ATP-binding protein
VFHTRCPRVMPRCIVDVPASLALSPERSVACHLYD